MARDSKGKGRRVDEVFEEEEEEEEAPRKRAKTDLASQEDMALRLLGA